MRYTRAELGGILAARAGQHEGQGEHAYIEFRMKVTPEVLDAVMRGEFVTSDGRRTRLEAVNIDGNGYIIPEFVEAVTA